MEVINPFIRDNQQRMVMFLDELSVRVQVSAFKIFSAICLANFGEWM